MRVTNKVSYPRGEKSVDEGCLTGRAMGAVEKTGRSTRDGCGLEEKSDQARQTMIYNQSMRPTLSIGFFLSECMLTIVLIDSDGF